MSHELVWHERYNIGVSVIDKEHKKLFGIMNRLMLARKQGEKGKWVYQEGIKYFKEHSTKHFAEEEAYMASIGYYAYDTHRRLHDNFRRKTLPELERELQQNAYSDEAVNHFLGVCVGWLVGHTLTEDHAIGGKTETTTSQWENLLPEEEQALVSRLIVKLTYDMFQMDSRLVSGCYGGEKIGNSIYYRVVYGTKQGEIWETILILEEQVIINTIGKMMATESDELSVMMINATRYTAQQFIRCINDHFPKADEYEMKEENLLSYEQFHKMFENKQPQLSLLFSTNVGYLAYCVTAPHLFRGEKSVSSIKAENAIAEVSKYLKAAHDAEKKKKILVVDDSDFALLAMKNLLESDYEIATAKSGMAAIMSLTLDRPDLILLDYEMPVCDGHQVLEMIRAEKDIADTPVMFISGSSSKERIQKLLELKPAGYLLKSMEPSEIKKGIDNYFKNN